MTVSESVGWLPRGVLGGLARKEARLFSPSIHPSIYPRRHIPRGEGTHCMGCRCHAGWIDSMMIMERLTDSLHRTTGAYTKGWSVG